jgi:hypothetical protein
LTHPLDLLRAKECIVASDVSMLELVERATSASVFRSSGSNVRRDFAGRLTHARFRVRMMDDTGRSEREPAGRAEAMILRRHRHRAASVQFHLLEQAGVLRRDGVAETEADHFMNCPGCGEWFDMRDLSAVLDHEGPLPLPHPAEDQPQ